MSNSLVRSTDVRGASGGPLHSASSSGDSPEMRRVDKPEKDFSRSEKTKTSLLSLDLSRVAISYALLVGGVGCGICADDASGTRFGVRGLVEHTYYDWSGDVKWDRTTSFQLDVQGCQWFVRLVQPFDWTPYSEVSFDGDKTYWLQSLQTWVDKLKATNASSIPTNVAVGVVRRSAVPRFGFGHEVGPIWLAYASSCYFRSATSDVVESPATLGVLSGRDANPDCFLTQRAAWNLSSSRPFVPSRVVYFDSGTNWLGFKPSRYPKPFDAGFTNTFFEVTAWTNVGDYSFPLRASMLTYSVNQSVGNSEPSLALIHRYRLTATNFFDPPLRIHFQPAIPGVTVVSDERFNDAKVADLHFNYYNTNRWATDEEVKATRAYRVAAAGVSNKVSATRPVLVRLAIIITLTVPFLVVLVQRLRRASTG